MSRTIHRRTLLQGISAAAALPFLSKIPSAHAQTIPRRLVVFFSGNEPIDRAHWYPGTGFTLTPVMKALEPHKPKLVMLGGMKMGPSAADPYNGHNCIGHVLTGHANKYYGTKSQFWGGGISIDHFLAQRLGVPSLTLGAKSGNSTGTQRMSYAGASQPVHPIDDPLKAFANTFGNVSTGGGSTGPDPRQLQRKSVLDALARDLTRVRAGVPAADRHKLDQHLEAVRALEQRLSAPPPANSCSPTPVASGIDYTANANFPLAARAQMDIIVQALACDLTRVATLQLGGSAGSGTPNWPNEGLTFTRGEHEIAHNYYSSTASSAVPEREAVEAFYYRLFAELLAKMDAVPEGDGTLLDNSLVLWVKPMGQKHGVSDLLFMLAGSAQGALKTGRYLEFKGRPHNDLLTSVCHLMGQTTVERFGDPAFCTGPLAL